MKGGREKGGKKEEKQKKVQEKQKKDKDSRRRKLGLTQKLSLLELR